MTGEKQKRRTKWSLLCPAYLFGPGAGRVCLSVFYLQGLGPRSPRISFMCKTSKKINAYADNVAAGLGRDRFTLTVTQDFSAAWFGLGLICILALHVDLCHVSGKALPGLLY